MTRRSAQIEAARKRPVDALERQMKLADDPGCEKECQRAVAATARAEAKLKEMLR
jgi:hypothetical protein